MFAKNTCIRKICNFTIKRNHIKKSKETRMVADACRYCSGQIISIFQTVAMSELKIKGSLEYKQMWATTLVSSLYINPY